MCNEEFPEFGPRLEGKLLRLLSMAASGLRSRWRPEGLTSNRAFPPAIEHIVIDAESGERRTITAQQIAYRHRLPVDVEKAEVVGGRMAVAYAIQKGMHETEKRLRKDGYVVDSDGLVVEVVVQLLGKVWPAVADVTIPHDAEPKRWPHAWVYDRDDETYGQTWRCARCGADSSRPHDDDVRDTCEVQP